jgi:hypothetical protein
VEENQIKFLFDQFKESGSHARHLENLRAQHMAFFFTVLLASVGAVVAVALLVLDATLAAWIVRGGIQEHWRLWPWVVLTLMTLPLFCLQATIYLLVGIGKAEGVVATSSTLGRLTFYRNCPRRLPL